MIDNSNTAPMTQNPCYGQFIKPLIWDDEPKEKHFYKCVSVSYVQLPVQGNWKSHIAICDEGDYGFKATLWLMNGGYGITNDCYCRTFEDDANAIASQLLRLKELRTVKTVMPC